MSRRRSGLLAFVALLFFAASARAQVAFVPQVGAFPNGVMLGTTPVVSADRRYVRLGMNPQFTALEGFTTFAVPAAVGGRGGFPSAFPGGTYRAGMDGPISMAANPSAPFPLGPELTSDRAFTENLPTLEPTPSPSPRARSAARAKVLRRRVQASRAKSSN
jgi:hypothetical protein